MGRTVCSHTQRVDHSFIVVLLAVQCRLHNENFKACAHGKEVARATCLQLEGYASCLLKRGGHTER